MSHLAIEQKEEAGTLRLTLSGQIDEAADYSPVAHQGKKRIEFDFEKVGFINSTGLQRWIKFLQAIAPETVVAFTRCSIRVVTQLNMFPGFLAGRKVAIDSFFAPYFCEACDQACELLLDVKKHQADLMAARAPKQQCPRCKKDAEFDGIEKKYFLFLSA
jgi:hypothetical protein